MGFGSPYSPNFSTAETIASGGINMDTLRRAFKNILRSKYRTLLVSLVLALCVAVFASTLAGVDASEAATADMLEEYEQAAEATLEQTELLMTAIQVMAGRMPMSQEPMDEGIVDEILSMDNVEAVVPAVSGGFGEGETEQTDQPGGGGAMFMTRNAFTVMGVPLDSELDEEYSVLPVNIIDGQSLEEGESDTVLISEGLTDYFGAAVGDTIDIDGTSFEVAGIYTGSMMENQVYMSLSDAQDLLDMEGELSMLTVYAESTSTVDDVVDEIESEYPDLMVMAMSDMQSQFGDVVQREQERILGSVDENMAHIQSLGLSIMLVSGIAGVLLILGLMFYTVRERTKEIGTLKALGFSNPQIMKQFIYEGLYIGIIGGVVGLAVSTVAASLLSSWLLNTSETLDVTVSVVNSWSTLMIGLGMAVIAAALGSLYPAWRASRVSPMQALKHT